MLLDYEIFRYFREKFIFFAIYNINPYISFILNLLITLNECKNSKVLQLNASEGADNSVHCVKYGKPF